MSLKRLRCFGTSGLCPQPHKDLSKLLSLPHFIARSRILYIKVTQAEYLGVLGKIPLVGCVTVGTLWGRDRCCLATFVLSLRSS